MAGPKSLIFFGLLILLVACAGWAAAQTCSAATTMSTTDYPKLSRLTFNSAQQANYQYTAGVTFSSSGFTFASPQSSSAAVAFSNRLHVRSGFQVDFTYKLSSTTNAEGFAFVVQNDGADQREGSNQFLGYNLNKAVAIEFDFFTNTAPGGTDCSGPHAMVSTSGPATRASWVCNQNLQTSLTASFGTTAVSVTIRFVPTGTIGTYDIILIINGVPKTFPSVSLALGFDLANSDIGSGAAWVGFTTAARDGVTPASIDITDVSIRTPRISNLIPSISSDKRVVSDSFTSTTAYNASIKLVDVCGSTIRVDTEDTLSATNWGFTYPSGIAALSCSVGPATRTVANTGSSTQELRVSARVACQKVTAGSSVLSYRVQFPQTDSSPTLEKPVNLQFIPGDAVARNSQIIKVVAGAATVCDSAVSCSTAVSSSIVAGTAISVTFELYDAFSNKIAATSSTQITMNINPSPDTASQNIAGINPILSVTPTALTPVGGSKLAVTINSQSLTTSITFNVIAAAPYGPTSVVSQGTGLSEYVAGFSVGTIAPFGYNFVLSLKDKYNNPILASSLSPTDQSSITFTLRFKAPNTDPTSATDCTGTGTGATGFAGDGTGAARCPTTPAATPSQDWGFYAQPTTAGTYLLVCTIGSSTSPCFSFSSSGYEITVVPADEDATKTSIDTSNSNIFPLTAGAMASKSSLPANPQYLTVGTRSAFSIKVFDKYQNPRNSRNKGTDFTISAQYTWTDPCDASASSVMITDTFICGSSSPPTSNGVVMPTSDCTFSSTNGYSINFAPKRTTYLSFINIDTATNVLIISITQGAAVSVNKYFVLSQAGAPTTVSPSPCSALAAQFTNKIKTPVGNRLIAGSNYIANAVVEYNLFPVDAQGNYIQPISATLGTVESPTNVDELQNSFQLVHLLTGTTSPGFLPLPLSGLISGRPVFYWTAGTNKLAGSWKTSYRLRGAFSHSVTAFFKQAQWAATPFTVYPGYPTSIPLTGAFIQYPQSTNAASKYVLTYRPVDAFGNPTWFDPTQFSGNPSSAVGVVSGGAGCSSDPVNIPSTDLCIVSALAGAPTVCTITLDRAAAGTLCVLTVTTIFNSPTPAVSTAPTSLDISFPLFSNVQFTSKWVRKPYSATIPALPVDVDFNNTPITATAGDYIFVKFTTNSNDPLNASYFTLDWSQGVDDFSMPIASQLSQIGSTKSFYIVYQSTTVGSSYTLKTLYLGVSSGDFTGLVVNVSAFSLSTSVLNVPTTGYSACDDTTKTSNIITLTAVDRFSNPILSASSIPITWSTATQPTLLLVSAATRTGVTNVFTYKFCYKTASYLQFNAVAATAGASGTDTVSSITVISPAQPLKFVTSSAIQCTIDASCVARFNLYDKFDNALTTTDRATYIDANLSFSFSDASTTAPSSNSAVANSFSTTPPTAEISIILPSDITESGDVITIQFSNKYLKYVTPSGATNTGIRKFVAQFSSPTSVETLIDISTTIAPPTYYSVKQGASTFFSTGNRVLTPVQASSTAANLQFSLYDAYFNQYKTQSDSDLSGNFIASGSQFVALASSVSRTNGVYNTNPIFQYAAPYSLNNVVVNGAPLPGLTITVSSGPISRWDFVHPNYGDTRTAGDSNSPTTSWGVNGTPYDEFGNKVNDPSLIASSISQLRLRVFEGATTCSNSVPSLASNLSSEVTDTSVFSIVAGIQDGASFVVPFQVYTTRANTLTVAGTRLTYTYYFKLTPTSTTVTSCSGATINIGPAAINKANTDASIVGLTNSAVRQGTKLTFTVTPLDKFNNFVGYTADPSRDQYTPTVTQCGTSTVVTAVNSLDTVPSQRDISVTVAAGISTFSISAGGAEITNCQTLLVYASFPATVLIDDSAVTTLTTPYNLKMTAGVPQTFKLSSKDAYGTDVDYNNIAMKTPRSWKDFDSMQYIYKFTAKFSEPIKSTDPDATFSSSDLDYSVEAYSAVPNFTQDGAPPVTRQEVSITPAWPGYYSISVVVVERTTLQPLVLTDNLLVNVQINLNPSQRLLAANPICSDLTPVYQPSLTTPFGICEALDSQFFTCTGSVSDLEIRPSDYSLVSGCQCGGGFKKCGSRCINASDCPPTILATEPLRVCPLYTILCGDLITCAKQASECPAIQDCPVSEPNRCYNGNCAVSEAACGTVPSCPSNSPYMCPSGVCVANGSLCQQLRECNAPAIYRCPADGTCVTTSDQCPTSVGCPINTFKCPTGECVRDISTCPEIVACPAIRPYRCSDGTCSVDNSFCPTPASCGAAKPILCPDRKSCVTKAESCAVVQPCPDGSILCSTGDCRPEGQCPSAVTCPPSNPVGCPDGRCVTSKSSCDSSSIPICPASAPIRCGSGRCVKDYALCDQLISCPYWKPILCSSGQCVSAMEACPEIPASSVCPSNYVTCPVTGACAKFYAWCPTLRTCLPDQIRCANGQCYPASTSPTVESCPPQARKVLQCADGLILCPITNTGVMCRTSISECPTDVVCPSSSPFRCESNQCAVSPDQCAIMDATEIPDTRVPCGMGTWASSDALCGTPPTCPQSQPALCLDGSCRQHPNDCPINNECPPNLPFKCASGECQLNSYSCSLSKCSDANKPVRCPYATANTRCVAKVEDCPNVFDSSLLASFTSLCTFGARCWDGTCVSETRLCPTRRCAPEAPFLCLGGTCAQNEGKCPTTQGCPFDLPFFCPVDGSCQATSLTCATVVDVPCPSTETVDADGNTVTTALVKCSDGSCRENQDACLFTGPFGCAPETPIRCGDGTCTVKPSASDPITACQASSDAYNACTADRPYRCPGGFCSTSSTRCPTPSIDLQRPVCRSISNTEYMSVTCDDGSCAFSYAECPTIRPCSARQFRCGDGSCRDLPCDPNLPACRNRLAGLDNMGAFCPSVNSCPEHLPYRCQSGECSLGREQCQSLYPIRLNKCCGISATYSPSSGTLTPQGEDLGLCTELTGSTTCIDSRLVDDDSGRSGCPLGTQRCGATGHCIDSAYFTELCEIYSSSFDDLQSQSFTCAYRCPSGRCVDSAKQCTEPNGCETNTPVLCSDGICVADSASCTVATEPTCELTCPGQNKRCVTSIDECTTQAGCPLATPFLCADGTCKTKASTQQGSTLQPYPQLTPNGLAADMCQPIVKCSGFTPFLCGDGSCQPDNSSCPPMVNRCGGVCRVACPLTNECVQLESIAINSIVLCDLSALTSLCTKPTAQCPAIRPLVCPNGACVAAPTDCSSPFFDDARTLSCSSAQPFRCVNGDCVDSQLACLQSTALANGFEAPTASTAITNTNVCKSAYACPDGSCVQSSFECGFIAACPSGYTRCATGICKAPVFDGTVWTEFDCSTLENIPTESCSGATSRCADGLCRAVCPQTSGCSLTAPFSCSWSATARCTKNAAECTGFNLPENNAFVTTSISALSSYSTAQLYRFDELASRFEQLDFVTIQKIADKMDSQWTDNAMATLATTAQRYSPDSTTVSTCFSNCERDIPAIQSTTLIHPASTVSNLVVSANQYSVPRTFISIPAGTVNVASEFNIYPTPEQLFDGADFLTSGLTLPFAWQGEPGSGTPGEFNSKVISTPFTCSVTRNNTIVPTNKPFAITSYVDLKSYKASTGTDTATVAEFPCAFIGAFDSAIAGKGCGGTTTITNSTLSVNYDSTLCGWTGGNALQLEARFDSIVSVDDAPDTVEWNGQSARQVICMTVLSSSRQFGADSSGAISGQQFCAIFVRITDLILITFPDNFIVAPQTEDNLLSPDNLTASRDKTTFPASPSQVISNAYLYDANADPTVPASSACSTSSSDISKIQKQDICLGRYSYEDASWDCIAPTFENRTANPTWVSGMRLSQVSASVPACNQDAYAFIFVPLPEPVEESSDFCFWCTYGWIILLVCCLFVVILLIVIFCAFRFYRHRMQYKEEQKKLQGLQEHALDLAENQGGLGVADADGEINMTVNPLVLQLQDLNKQLEDANLELNTVGQEEEFHIQRLAQQKARIQAEIQKLETSLATDESAKLAPKRIEAAGPKSSGPGPQGPMRTGGAASGPTGVSNTSGPMRAPPK